MFSEVNCDGGDEGNSMVDIINESLVNNDQLETVNVINSPMLLYSPTEITLFESYINNILSLEQIILIFLGMILNILIIRFLTRKLQNNKYTVTKLNYK